MRGSNIMGVTVEISFHSSFVRKYRHNADEVEGGGWDRQLTCFLGELGHSGQHRRVPGLKEIDHEQGQGVVIEEGATPCVNNQSF